jgi:hypothetical protein
MTGQDQEVTQPLQTVSVSRLELLLVQLRLTRDEMRAMPDLYEAAFAHKEASDDVGAFLHEVYSVLWYDRLGLCPDCLRPPTRTVASSLRCRFAVCLSCRTHWFIGRFNDDAFDDDSDAVLSVCREVQPARLTRPGAACNCGCREQR